MTVNRLEFKGFRNLENGVLCPASDINIIYGKNAQGKTNLLEALWLFTGSRSFRNTRDADTVAFDRDKARLNLNFVSGGREKNAQLTIEKRRTAVLGGIPLSSPAKLCGHFCAVVFSPTHLSLIKGAPEERRRFIDDAYCQVRPGYYKILAEHNRVLAQRNALLKKIREGFPADSMDVWNENLAMAGARVFAARTAYIRRLSNIAQDVYSGIAGGNERLELLYVSMSGDQNTPASTAYKNLITMLRQKLNDDIAAGFTTAGSHRDDLSVLIEGKPARIFGSQGQQRSAVLALKLAEATVLTEETGEHPVALLDDVLSELDTSRQNYILNHINGWQVFLTCCDPSPVYRLTGGRVFHVTNGQIEGEAEQQRGGK